MNTENIVMCVVALLLGMLLANMLKNVCGCKVVEGQSAVQAAVEAAVGKAAVKNLQNTSSLERAAGTGQYGVEARCGDTDPSCGALIDHPKVQAVGGCEAKLAVLKTGENWKAIAELAGVHKIVGADGALTLRDQCKTSCGVCDTSGFAPIDYDHHATTVDGMEGTRCTYNDAGRVHRGTYNSCSNLVGKKTCYKCSGDTSDAGHTEAYDPCECD